MSRAELFQRDDTNNVRTYETSTWSCSTLSLLKTEPGNKKKRTQPDARAQIESSSEEKKGKIRKL